MSIQSRLEDATTLAEAASAILHAVANGGPSTVVATEGGSVPSILKWFADLNSLTAGEAAALISDHLSDADPHPQYAMASALAEVATSGSYSSLADRPTLGTAAPLDTADAGDVRSAAANKVLTAENIATAAARVVLDYASPIAISWPGFINAEVTLTGTGTLGNPSDVIVDTVRTVLIKGADATPRAILYGSNYKGDLPVIEDVSDTVWYHLTIKALAADHVIVTATKALGD